MFNKKLSDEGKAINGGIAVTYLGESIPETVFQQKNEGDYFKREELGLTESWSVHYFKMTEDRFGFSASVGEGLGIDFTKQLSGDYFGTVALSANSSAKLILQRRFFNNTIGAVAPGIFLSMESRGYDDYCNDDACYNGFGPSNNTRLFSAGIRGRFLLRELRKPGFVLTGILEMSHIFEVNEPYVGFNISLTAF